MVDGIIGGVSVDKREMAHANLRYVGCKQAWQAGVFASENQPPLDISVSIRQARLSSTVKENYYFDNAATTWPKPETVYTFMDSFFRSHGVNPGRSGHGLAVEAEQMIFSTRKLLAQFFGFDGDANRVVFTQNATDALNMALCGLLGDGDHVITTALEHNAVLRPINHMQRDANLSVTQIAPDECGCIDVAKVEAAILPETQVLVVNHASNVIGVVQPLEALAKLVADRDIYLVVDSAQTAGVLDIDMSRLGIDVLTFTGHKGLFGPMGIGGLIVAENVDLKPSRFGGTGVDSISPYQPDVYPHRLEAGTLSIPGISGLNAAQKWFASLTDLEADPEADPGAHSAANNHTERCRLARAHIHATEMQHCDRIRNHLKQFDHVKFVGQYNAQLEYIATLSFSADNMPASQLAEMLDADHHVCVRYGLHCAPEVHRTFGTAETGGAVRISPGFFTETEDVDHLLEALSDVLS